MNQEMRDKWGGGSKITVVEKAQTVSSYDPNKGLMYLVSALGLKFTDRHGLSGVSLVSLHMESVFLLCLFTWKRCFSCVSSHGSASSLMPFNNKTQIYTCSNCYFH